MFPHAGNLIATYEKIEDGRMSGVAEAVGNYFGGVIKWPDYSNSSQNVDSSPETP